MGDVFRQLKSGETSEMVLCTQTQRLCNSQIRILCLSTTILYFLDYNSILIWSPLCYVLSPEDYIDTKSPVPPDLQQPDCTKVLDLPYSIHAFQHLRVSEQMEVCYFIFFPIRKRNRKLLLAVLSQG